MARHGIEAVGKRHRHGERDARTAEALHHGARPVRRQFQHRRRSGKALCPVSDLAIERVAVQPAALPQRIVDILDRQRGLDRQWGLARQRRQRCGPACRERRIGRPDFLDQDTARPAVRDDVVHHDDRDVLAVTEPQQRRPERWPAFEIERPGGERARDGLGVGLACRRRGPGQVEPLKPERARRIDHLPHAAVGDGKARAQCLVPPHDFVERSLEGRGVERPDQPNAGRDVVGRPQRLDLL